MLGLVLLVFTAIWYYRLADEFNKNMKWVYPLIAIVTFFGTQFIAGVLIGIIAVATDSYELLSSELTLNLIGVAVGFSAVAGLYYILRNSWKKNRQKEDMESEVIDTNEF